MDGAVPAGMAERRSGNPARRISVLCDRVRADDVQGAFCDPWERAAGFGRRANADAGQSRDESDQHRAESVYDFPDAHRFAGRIYVYAARFWLGRFGRGDRDSGFRGVQRKHDALARAEESDSFAEKAEDSEKARIVGWKDDARMCARRASGRASESRRVLRSGRVFRAGDGAVQDCARDAFAGNYRGAGVLHSGLWNAGGGVHAFWHCAGRKG